MVQAGCLAFVVIVALIALGNQYPWIWAVLAALIVAAVAFNLWKKRQNKIASIGSFEEQAHALDLLAEDVAKGQTTESVSFALKAGETVLGSQDNIGLLEWVGTGSSYRGGNSGFSFRVMKGVSYRIGSSRGQLVKNPAALSTLDSGSVTYTTERITFVGGQQTRTWEVAKMLDLNTDHNGLTVMISVSNRQKPSGLQGASFSLVAPAFLVQAALTTHNSGKTEAAKELREAAEKFRSAAQALRVEMKLT